MNEKNAPPLSEDDVRFSGEVYCVESVSITETIDELTNRKLRSSVLYSDSAHRPDSLISR